MKTSGTAIVESGLPAQIAFDRDYDVWMKELFPEVAVQILELHDWQSEGF